MIAGSPDSEESNNMKKMWKYLCATAVLCVAAVGATGCHQWDTPYEKLDETGYTVSVRFDANGGVFAGTKDVSVVDVFNAADYKTNAEGEVEIPLIAPDDTRRKDSAFAASYNGHFLAGWYTERTPRVDGDGEPLDAYGQPTAVSGREQGYVYSGKWNFETDRLTVSTADGLTSEENQLTLYAAWIPYFNYEFYAVDGEGTSTLVATKQLIEIEMPVWNESTGKLDMNDVPGRDDMTFEAAYLDAAMSEPAGETVSGLVDYEKGIAVTDTVKIYTTWMEGTWFRIHTAKQLFDNSRLGGNYILCADLDFSNTVWAPALTTGEFTGTILGNGHKIMNVTVLQGDNSKINGGLFGTLGATAQLSDVTFENITYRIQAGSRMQSPNYGLLAGTVNAGATFENVSVTGTIEVGKNCYRPNDYNIGLLCGAGTAEGIDFSGITCTVEDPDHNTARVEVDTATGQVTLTFAE